jgi:hypothetical protein
LLHLEQKSLKLKNEFKLVGNIEAEIFMAIDIKVREGWQCFGLKLRLWKGQNTGRVKI